MTTLNIDDLVLNDITVEDITNDTDTGVYDKLMAAVESDINKQFLEGRITNSDYASVYLQSLQAVLRESIQFVLQQQLIEAQTAGAIKDLELKDSQVGAANFGLRAELEKQWGYDTTVDDDGALLSIEDSDTDGKIDKEIKALASQETLTEAQVSSVNKDIEAKEAEIGKLNSTLQAELEKNWGYTVTLDADGNVAAITDSGIEGRIDKEITNLDAQGDLTLAQITAVNKDLDVKDAQISSVNKDIEVKEAEISKLNSTLQAELEKNWGYVVTLDGDGNVASIVDSATEGKIDKEITSIQTSIDLTEEQRNTAYTQRVMADKQVAKLGLDNVMRISEAARDQDADFVYDPQYTTS